MPASIESGQMKIAMLTLIRLRITNAISPKVSPSHKTVNSNSSLVGFTCKEVPPICIGRMIKTDVPKYFILDVDILVRVYCLIGSLFGTIMEFGQRA